MGKLIVHFSVFAFLFVSGGIYGWLGFATDRMKNGNLLASTAMFFAMLVMIWAGTLIGVNLPASHHE